MHQRLLNRLCRSALVLALCSAAATASANDPIRIVVPFSPGGPADTLARALADHAAPKLGEVVIVENRPGAGNLVALDYVKRSKPDGRTLFFTSPSPFNLYPLTYRKLNYDHAKDFVPVAQVAEFTNGLAASVAHPYRTAREYVDYLKQNPTRGQIGVTALGSGNHMATVVLGDLSGVKTEPVSYKGGAAMAADLIGLHLPAAMDNIGSFLQMHRAGKLRVIAITGTTRSKAAPDIPTFEELGLAGLDKSNGWYGLFAPAGSPKATLDRLEKALVEAANDPAIQAAFIERGLEIGGRSGESLGTRIRQELETWAPIVRTSGFVVTD